MSSIDIKRTLAVLAFLPFGSTASTSAAFRFVPVAFVGFGSSAEVFVVKEDLPDLVVVDFTAVLAVSTDAFRLPRAAAVFAAILDM